MSAEQQKPVRKHTKEWFDALIIAAIIATVLRIFVVESYRIPTGSMENTLLAGDFLFVNKYVYGARVPFTDYRLPGVDKVERGDVIVFKFPKDRSLNYIKRCVAVSGDTIEIRDQQVYVNGNAVHLPEHGQFMGQKMPPGAADFQIFPRFSTFNKDNYGPLRIPRKGDVIDLNEKTYQLYSSLVADEGHDISLIDGRVYVDGVLSTAYIVEDDYYFAMGDNRDNSLDSRYWGFLPGRDILGEAMMVYWSWDPNRSLLFDPAGKLTSIRWGRAGMVVH
ncbi:MAG: signal peptidase I [Chlorobi bacterium]|nr:signal peptidase I [Chlorobiota bacterium]